MTWLPKPNFLTPLRGKYWATLFCRTVFFPSRWQTLSQALVVHLLLTCRLFSANLDATGFPRNSEYVEFTHCPYLFFQHFHSTTSEHRGLSWWANIWFLLPTSDGQTIWETNSIMRGMMRIINYIYALLVPFVSKKARCRASRGTLAALAVPVRADDTELESRCFLSWTQLGRISLIVTLSAHATTVPRWVSWSWSWYVKIDVHYIKRGHRLFGLHMRSGRGESSSSYVLYVELEHLAPGNEVMASTNSRLRLSSLWLL